MKQPEEGRYVISEVGDLGMGLTPINEEQEIDHKTQTQEELI